MKVNAEDAVIGPPKTDDRRLDDDDWLLLVSGGDMGMLSLKWYLGRGESQVSYSTTVTKYSQCRRPTALIVVIHSEYEILRKNEVDIRESKTKRFRAEAVRGN